MNRFFTQLGPRDDKLKTESAPGAYGQGARFNALARIKRVGAQSDTVCTATTVAA
jgi:hypothetical protein